MASLKTHADSPFFYLSYRDANGARKEKSLRPLRHGIREDRRKALIEKAKYTQEENERGPARQGWESWVPTFLDVRYPASKPAGKRVREAWRHVSDYLKEKGVFGPTELTRELCMDYMAWRKVQTVGEHPVAHNTARMELVYLGVVCEEAVNRQMLVRNPAHRLGIGKERGKIKAAMSDDHIAKIRVALETEPAWMRHAFEVAIHQGCRIGETPVFVDDVDFSRNSIHLRKTKGDKPFTAPMNPALKPLLETLVKEARAAGRQTIFEIPPSGKRRFHRLFDSLRVNPDSEDDTRTFRDAGITFHSTRVTVATRLAQGDYSKSKAMRLLNHSSELVHSTYQRLQSGDVADAFSVLQIPAHPAGSPLSEKSDDPLAK